MNDTFIRLFVEKLKLPFEYNLSSIEVYPNERNRCEHKEIDILLIDRKRHSAIIIENKIRAKDSNHTNEGQLERYYRIITQDEGIPEDSTSVVYLSIDRDAPSDESVATSGQFPGLKKKVRSIHYGVEILDWLRNCARESYNRPILRESLVQYIKLVENMTTNNTSEEDIKSLILLVGKNNDNLMSAKRLIDNSRHMHWWAIFEFWKLLSDKFADWGYTVRQSIENGTIDDCCSNSPMKRKRAVFDLELTTPEGFDFIVYASYEEALVIGVYDEDLKPVIRSKSKKFYKEYHDKLGLQNFEGWLFFKIFEFENSEELYLHNFGDELTFNLISESHRNKVVDIIIKQTKDLLKCYNKFLKNN